MSYAGQSQHEGWVAKPLLALQNADLMACMDAHFIGKKLFHQQSQALRRSYRQITDVSLVIPMTSGLRSHYTGSHEKTSTGQHDAYGGFCYIIIRMTGTIINCNIRPPTRTQSRPRPVNHASTALSRMQPNAHAFHASLTMTTSYCVLQDNLTIAYYRDTSVQVYCS